MKRMTIVLIALLASLAGSAPADEAADTAQKSEAINSIAYDAGNQTLTIAFDRGTYVYSGVPTAVYDGLKNSDSQGSYYGENIKGKYPSKKQGE